MKAKRKPVFYRLYVFLFFVGIFCVGGMYSNCGSVIAENEVRQVIFIDEVQDIHGLEICRQGENCANEDQGLDQKNSGTYKLQPVELQN